MTYLGKNLRRTVVSFHVLFSALWAGAAISMIVLMVTKDPQNVSELFAYNLAIKLIDDWIIIGSASACLATGLLLSWKTPWGFFKQWWVGVKIILTIAMMLFGTFGLGEWTNQSVTMVQEHGLDIFSNKEYLEYQSLSMIWGSIQFGALIFIFFISIFKPKRKFQRIK
jgi:hypothetical protein